MREDTPLINTIKVVLHVYNVPSCVPLVDKKYDNHLIEAQTDLLPVKENYEKTNCLVAFTRQSPILTVLLNDTT